jgi:hypothetical protein
MNRSVVALLLLLVAPCAVYAQASITGVVRDTSGGVLPGVTVEATSPVLIEKVRTAQTDASGQYRIVDLRPGNYAVTFTLPGFAAVKREGIALEGAFNATINVEMRVGALEETVTVTGETPVVDVQNARRQQVMNSELVNTIPAARAYNALMVLVPGVVLGFPGTGDVVTSPVGTMFGIHGGPTTEGRVQVDGLNIGASRGGAGVSGYIVDTSNAQEITFSTSGGLGEAEVGGPFIQVVPRTGGNTMNGSFYIGGMNDAMQGSNYTEELQRAGLRVPSKLLKVWDVNGSVGGPVRKDRLWYFFNVRDQGSARSVPGMYANLNAGNPEAWTYVPDTTRQARSDSSWRSAGLRLTWQATARNKINLFWDEQHPCSGAGWSPEVDACRHSPEGWIIGGSATSAPETATYGNAWQRVQQASWTSPFSSRILFEGGYGNYLSRWGGGPAPGNPTRDLIRVTEVAGAIPGITYRSVDWSEGWISANTWRATMSYVTGAHNLKFGYQGAFHLDNQNSNFTNAQYLTYRLSNGVPNQLTMSSGRFDSKWRTRYNALYVQDQSTFKRLTVQGALRYERAWSYFPEQGLGGTRFIPNQIVFPRTDGVKGFNDISPRLGVAYDVFGNSRTSVKGNLGRYLEPAQNGGRYTATAPTSRVATSTNRAWIDQNGNYVADCDLMNPAGQDLRASGGDFCGPFSNNNFGTSRLGVEYDPALLEGWGVRPFDWQFGIALQQQIVSRVSAEVQYNRRWWNGFMVNDNLAVTSSDFTPYSITAPLDPRLPGGGGYIINGFYDVRPDLFGRVDYFVTDAANFGKQTHHWQGVDVMFNVRLSDRLQFQGGTSTGQTVTDNCEVANNLPESLAPPQTITIGVSLPGPSALGVAQPGLTPSQYCHLSSGFLTQVKGLGSFTVPRIDVLLSATFQSNPGPQLAANYFVPNAAVAPSLGRNLAGGAPNVFVNLVTPGTLYGDRVNQLDVRLGKILRFGRTRTQIAVDVYNVANSAAVLGYNQTFNPATTTWLTPTSVLSARFVKLSANVDF